MIHALAGFAFLAAALKVSRGGTGSFAALPRPDNRQDWLDWMEIRFAPGTPVILEEDTEAKCWCGTGDFRAAGDFLTLKAGLKLRVDDDHELYDEDGDLEGYALVFERREEMFTSSIVQECHAHFTLEELDKSFRPLVDNFPQVAKYKGRPYKGRP